MHRKPATPPGTVLLQSVLKIYPIAFATVTRYDHVWPKHGPSMAQAGSCRAIAPLTLRARIAARECTLYIYHSRGKVSELFCLGCNPILLVTEGQNAKF